MKVLIVNYYYPPVVTAHCYRWHQMARYWVDAGHDVEVITAKVSGLPLLSDEGGVRVCRTSLVPQSKTTAMPNGRVDATLKSRILNMLRPLYRRIYWPDAVYHWLPYLLWQMWVRRNNSYDLIVTSYPVFAAPLSGWFYLKICRKERPRWIIDYGDPFSTSDSMPPNNYALYGRFNRRVESLLARRADRLVLTSRVSAEQYVRAGIAPTEKVWVIPHLVDVDLFYAGEKRAKNFSDGEEIHLVYTGALHKNIREPGILYRLISDLNSISDGPRYVLDIYGPSNGVEVAPRDNHNVRYHGAVSRDKAIVLMSEADILVDIGNDNCSMVPSKITEYVATGRAVIAIEGNGLRHDAMNRYEKVGRILVVDKHDPSLLDVRAVCDYINVNAGSCISRSALDLVLEPFILEGVAASYKKAAML